MDKPNRENHWHRKYRCQAKSQTQQEEPVATGVTARLAQMALQKAVISQVGLPGDIERISEKGNGSDKHSDAEVCGHANERYVGDAPDPGGQWNDERKNSGHHVSEDWNETDDTVKPESDRRARDAEGFVEQDLQSMERVVTKEPRAGVPARLRGVRSDARNGGKFSHNQRFRGLSIASTARSAEPDV